MATINITIKNNLFHHTVDEFLCRDVDISDLEEVNYCVEECIGAFIDIHEDALKNIDAEWDTIMDNFHYTIEEVMPNELF
jgi:hypothetical protein